MALTLDLLEDIETTNSWLKNKQSKPPLPEDYIHRRQEVFLLDPEWDTFALLLIGPRRTGKTTLGNYLCDQLLLQQRFQQVLYLNCDLLSIRQYFRSPSFLVQLMQHYQLFNPIIFIDEAQRLEEAGVILKAFIDLQVPVKMIVTGSSQLEIKSKVTEHLTGRALEAIILPLSDSENSKNSLLEEKLIYGCYPSVVAAMHKQTILAQLYKQYIEKDIVEILKVGKPHVIEKLLTLIAHSSGQLVNYQVLANDCQVSIPTLQSHLQKLEQTYVIARVTPFVGNKRTEVTHNPIYYFIDNGFRNQAIRNFSLLNMRHDVGMMVESLVFQELYKFKVQNFYDMDIHFWRTKAGAEVDFVLQTNSEHLLPIEVKYRPVSTPKITRGYRSFLQAYQPKYGVILTRELLADEIFEKTQVKFIPVTMLAKLFEVTIDALGLHE